MSDLQTSLNGAEFKGPVTIADTGPRGMITLRGDLAGKKLQAAVKSAVGLDVPGVNECAFEGDNGVAWGSPDELFLFCAYDAVDAALEKLHKGLKGQHYLAAKGSDSRVILSVRGSQLRDVLGKLTPADLSAEAFGPGTIRRTRLAQIPAAIWMTEEDAAYVLCFRSVAQYAFDILKAAAGPGSEVGFY